MSHALVCLCLALCLLACLSYKIECMIDALCSIGYVPPKLSPVRSSSSQSAASDNSEAEQEQPTPQQSLSIPQGTLSTPLRTLSSPPEMAFQAGQDGTAHQASAQQSRTVSGSFSSLSVERHQNSSGSAGFADVSGMHHHHLQVLLLSVVCAAACVDKSCMLFVAPSTAVELSRCAAQALQAIASCISCD